MCYLLTTLMLPEQGIMGELDGFHRTHTFKSLLGPMTTTRSPLFARLLSHMIEEILDDEGNLHKIKTDVSLFEAVLIEEGSTCSQW